MNNHNLRSDESLYALLDSAKESYKNIHAPSYLRARVFAPRRKRDIFSLSVMRPAMALASLALIVGCVLFALPKNAHPLGTPVTTHTVSYQSGLARASLHGDETAQTLRTADNCILLDMDFECDVFVVVNRGKLLLADEEGNFHLAGQSCTVSPTQIVYWSVTPGTNQAAPVAQFMDYHENTLETLTLSYQTDEGVWYVFTEN